MKYTTIFSSNVRPVVSEEKDKYFKSRDKFNFFKDMLDSMRRNQKK